MRPATFALPVAVTLLISAGCSRNTTSAHQQQFQQDLAMQRHVDKQVLAGQEMMLERQQAQAEMLSALSPSHRQLLARLVGELATTQKPDVPAAIVALDTALTPAEKQAILKASTQLHRHFQQWLAGFERSQLAVPPTTATHIGQVHDLREDPSATLLLTVMNMAFVRTAMAVHSQSRR